MRSRICKGCGEHIGDHRIVCISCESEQEEHDEEKGELRQEIENEDRAAPNEN